MEFSGWFLRNLLSFLPMRVTIVGLFVCLALTSVAQKDIQKKIQTQFIEVFNGDVVHLPAGNFQMDASLWLDDKKNVTIKGKGKDKTILSFKNQISGAEGIKITNSENIHISDLSVQDTKGDGIKAQNVTQISFKNVKAEWTNNGKKENGGYGLYPVQCNNVLIDSCTAIGASDAGIYVGQSKNIIVRNSKAYNNVAGIEIENSLYADVFNNEVYDNTGGILVFDLPDLIQKEGGYVRVFKNIIRDNNHANFAPEGNIVGKVPQGTGLMILATRNVEVFENQIVNNITVSTAIISYYMTENPINDKSYKPFPDNIYIHHNHYDRPNVRTTGKGRMGKMYRFKLRFGKNVPHIQYDGIVDDAAPQRNICLRDNTNATFANINAANDFKNISYDMTPFSCDLNRIPAVMLTSK